MTAIERTETEGGGVLAKARAAAGWAVNRAIAVQDPAVERLASRVGYADAAVSPADAVRALDKHYRTTVVSLGAAGGGAAMIPGVGIVANIGEISAYLEATMLYSLTLARIHGVGVKDIDRRRMLLYTMLLGDAGAEAVERAAARLGKHWGKRLATAVPLEAVKAANKILGHNFITKWGTKQGFLVLGRDIPFGIGVGVGAGGNWLLARGTIRAGRSVFGPPPENWPRAD